MANYLQFTTPSGENVQFTVTAQANGSQVLYSQDFTTATSSSGIYLKVFETGDSANPITDYSTMEQGKLYDIEAYSDAGFTTPVDITSWSGTNVEFVGYTFDADRRPLYIVGYATTTQSGSEITFGTGNSTTKRKTPLTSASDSDFLDPAQNGRINWIDGDAASAIGYGFERINYSNIAGWTSLSNTNASWPALQGNNQPHYPSNPYTGMSLTEADVMASATSDVGAVTWDTPFTVGGYSNSDTANKGATDTTPGDQAKAWKAAVEYTKSLVEAEGGTPEVIAYCGYRPLWTDKTQTAFDKSLLGYSKPSTGNETAWDGVDANSPGWTPEPGWDGVGGTSSSSETFSAWFDEEAAGLYSLGFDSIGLDTGARVWMNSAGMSKDASGTEYTNGYGDFTGDDRLINIFNGYGLKPYFEAVPLDRWTHMTSYDKTKLVPMTGADASAYTSAAFWAFFGSWWGYVGDGGFSEFNNTLAGWQASGGSVFNETQTDGGATVGDPALAGAGVFGDDTEVHCVVRWGATETNAVLQLTDGWLKLRQMLYDFNQAGIIVSASANAQDTHHGVTAAEFYGFVKDLSTGVITQRPTIGEWREAGPTGIVYSPQITAQLLAGPQGNAGSLLSDSQIPTNQFESTSNNVAVNGGPLYVTRSNSGLYLGYYNTDVDNPPDYIAVWSLTYNRWLQGSGPGGGGYTAKWKIVNDTVTGQYRYRDNVDDTISNPGHANIGGVIIIGYDQQVDPVGDGWQDYDGPLPS